MALRPVSRSRRTDSIQKDGRGKRTVSLMARPRAGATYRPMPRELDCMENDYYRFLNQPRD